MATIYEVCELAGVSLATVSRVINKSGNVSAKTKSKVEAAMDQLGYLPNTAAQSLASNRTNSVGVLVSELSGPFFGPMMKGIESTLRHYEKHAIIAAGHSNEKEEIEAIEFLISKCCDALILHADSVSDDYLIELAKKDTPIIIMNRNIEAISEHCIHLDNELGGYLATKALLELGHTKLVNIAGPFWKSDAQQRLRGFKKALLEFNIEYKEEFVFEGDFQESGGAQGTKHFLDQATDFTGIVCGNDEMASGALDELRAHHLDIPRQISVIGFDNVTFAHYLYPKLTTVEYPIEEMGKMASQLIISKVYKRTINEIKQVFSPRLVERDSITAPLT